MIYERVVTEPDKLKRTIFRFTVVAPLAAKLSPHVVLDSVSREERRTVRCRKWEPVAGWDRLLSIKPSLPFAYPPTWMVNSVMDEIRQSLTYKGVVEPTPGAAS
jgi:hypothetical protein